MSDIEILSEREYTAGGKIYCGVFAPNGNEKYLHHYVDIRLDDGCRIRLSKWVGSRGNWQVRASGLPE